MQNGSHISKASSVQLANKTNYNEPFAFRTPRITLKLYSFVVVWSFIADMLLRNI